MRLPVIAIAVFAASFYGFGSAGRAEEATLLVLERAVTPQSPDGRPAVERGAGTIVRGVSADSAAGRGWNVTAVDNDESLGWIREGDAIPLEQYRKELRGRAAILAANSPPADDLPALIAAQPHSAVRLAWSDVVQAIAENEALPPGERLPDPYFARAKIWTTAGNHADAVQDYLTGIQLARVQNRSLASYETYFDQLADAAERLRSAPVDGKRGGNASFAEAALQSFSEGYAEIFGGDSRQALRHLTNAVQLDPTHPLYWYYRGIVHRQAGRGDQAMHDALIGASFEAESSGRYTILDERLSRIQGPDRVWLEKFRRGTFGS